MSQNGDGANNSGFIFNVNRNYFYWVGFYRVSVFFLYFSKILHGLVNGVMYNSALFLRVLIFVFVWTSRKALEIGSKNRCYRSWPRGLFLAGRVNIQAVCLGHRSNISLPVLCTANWCIVDENVVLSMNYFLSLIKFWCTCLATGVRWGKVVPVL